MTQMPPKVDVPRAAPVPPVPVTLADTGLTADKVDALIVKTCTAASSPACSWPRVSGCPIQFSNPSSSGRAPSA
jgi:hypothetical protein